MAKKISEKNQALAPGSYMKRLSKLEAKRNKFAKVQWGMSYDEHLLKVYDSIIKK